jgi:hypothetical protein
LSPAAVPASETELAIVEKLPIELERDSLLE